MEKVLRVEGMTCPNCVMHVTKALYKVRGVKTAVVDLDKKSAVVASDTELPDELLIGAIEDAGYSAKTLPAT